MWKTTPALREKIILFYLCCYLLSIFANNYQLEDGENGKNYLPISYKNNHKEMETTALSTPNNNPFQGKHFRVLLGVESRVHKDDRI
jgi:hypothetical protein